MNIYQQVSFFETKHQRFLKWANDLEALTQEQGYELSYDEHERALIQASILCLRASTQAIGRVAFLKRVRVPSPYRRPA